MKHSNRQSFEKYLKEAKASRQLPSLLMILSKDSFDRKSILDLSLNYLLKEIDNPELGLKVFDAENCEFSTILMELHSVNLFSKKQIVVIQQADKLAKNETTLLENYFAQPNSSIYLIISASAILHTSNFYKKAEKVGVVYEPVEEKAWEKEKSMSAWLAQKAAAEGVSLQPQVCQYLLKHIGNDQSTLHQEMEKLFCYIGERKEISINDVSGLCTEANQETVWQLGEAIFRQNTPHALRVTKALLDEGTPFLSLLRQIRNQFQTEYQVCSILNNGGSSVEVSQAFPYMRGQILERHMQMAHAYGMERFKKSLLKIDETELKAKNSGMDSDLLAELLIIHLTK